MPDERGAGSRDPATRLTLQQLSDSLGFLPAGIQDAELEHLGLASGEILFEQGDPADSLYVLIAGVLGVRVRHEDGSESEIDRLAPGAVVGEMALISDGARSATVYAVNGVELLRVSRSGYQAMVAETPGAEKAIGEGFDARWQRIQLASVLRDLLGEVDTLTLHELQDELEWRHLSNGEILFAQGSRPDGMYVVVNGRLRISVAHPDGQIEIAGDITPGETVGEFALITEATRSATVYAVRETNVVRMAQSTFNRLAYAHPRLMARLTEIIVARRQRALAQREKPRSLSVVLVAANNSVDLARFAEELSQAMARGGQVAVLDSARFDAEYGRNGASQTEPGELLDSAITSWLDEFECRSPFILYVAEPSLTAWTRRCIDHADRVLVVADPAEDPSPGLLEQALGEMSVPLRTDLALWHSEATERPSGTARWLQPRNLGAHYHVRQGTTAHMDRLARRLTGKSVALVLSGGGALAYCEMGVYKAFLELGIPIDYVGGTSMGAIVGGGIATGLLYGEMEELAQWTADQGVIDTTLPLASWAASRNVTRITERAFGRFSIEDLWLPYFCVSTNMTTAEPVVHGQGNMWRAVRASMSIPGIFVPLVEDGNVLIDGGVMDNFPVETMARRSDAGTIIGVNVVPYKERRREYDFDASLSGWRLLFNRLNPFSRRMRAPSMMQMLLRATEINGMRESKRQAALADLVISPDISGYKFTQYDQWQGLAERGYQAALEPLRVWHASSEQSQESAVAAG